MYDEKNFFAVFKAFLVSKYDLTSTKMLKDNTNKTEKLKFPFILLIKEYHEKKCLVKKFLHSGDTLSF